MCVNRIISNTDITPTITDVKESANRQPVATPPQSPKMVGRSPSQDLNKIEEREELDWTPRPRSYTEPGREREKGGGVDCKFNVLEI